jgi:hypothetical protein
MLSYASSQGELDIDEFLMGCYQLLAHGSHGFAWPFWILFAINENMWIVAFMAEIPTSTYIQLLRLQGDATGWSASHEGSNNM